MSECVICREAEGIGTPLAFHDDLVAVFPARWQPAGHRCYAFVVTRFHAKTLYDLDDEVIAHVMSRVRDVAKAVQHAAGADGTTLMQNNNPPGQEIDHVHFHVVPRFIGDDYWAASADAEVDAQDRQEQANELRSALAELGIASD